jgi:hypothetical protein
MAEFEIWGEDLHPAKGGFPKLLGRDIFVPLEDLAILVDEDGSPLGIRKLRWIHSRTRRMKTR